MEVRSSGSIHGTYVVEAGDSLMSIAAKVGNVTPAQLARYNKLGMLGVGQPPLFPGQSLYIPNSEELANQNVRLRSIPGTATRIPGEVSSKLNDSSSPSFPSKHDRNYSRRSCPTTLGDSGIPVQERLFVKVDAKRVLLPSKMHVDGILIVTPDAVCFDALATATALTRVVLTKKFSSNFSSDEKSDSDYKGQLNANSPPNAIELSPAEPKMFEHNPLPSTQAHTCPSSRQVHLLTPASTPVHDVVSLSVCIPVKSLVSINTHGILSGLLSGGLTKTKTTPCESSDFLMHIGNELCIDEIPQAPSSIQEYASCNSSDSVDDRIYAESASSEDVTSSPAAKSESVYISLGIDTPFITSSSSSTDSGTVYEAASTNFHVFQIASDKLADISFILATVANLAHSKQFSESITSESDLSLHQEKLHSTSLIESALLEMETTVFELSLQGGTSAILDEKMLKDLASGLPCHWTGSSIRPVFSTDRDGFSLNSLYRKTSTVNSVILLLIRDITNTTFGAVLSERMKLSTHFYGTGESCVFTWKPDFKRYDWTKKNYFFMRGAADCFLIGAKSGHSAIWFDEALKYGRSEATDTFDNPVLCGQSKLQLSSTRNKRLTKNLSSPNDKCPTSVPFIIDKLEVWEMLS